MKASRKTEVATPESDRLKGAEHPRLTNALFGHKHGEQALLNAYQSGRMPHAWLIGGPEGVGKATLAWRMTKFLTLHPDPTAPAVQMASALAVDPLAPAVRQATSLASPDISILRRGWNFEKKRHFTEISVDDARAALGRFHLSAAGDGWRVCIVDCADDLNKSSANALLKMIEEPPDRSVFFIIAHRMGQVLPTLRSRCRKLALEPLDPSAIDLALKNAGGSFAASDEKSRREAIEQAQGSVRRAMEWLLNAHLSAPFDRILANMPGVEWKAALKCIDEASKPGADEAFEASAEKIFAWLNTKLHEKAGFGPRVVVPYAKVWEKLREELRVTQVYNLDRRAFLMGALEDLSAL